MRIMVLNQAPHRGDTEYQQRVERILRSYASHGTEVDLCFPDDYPSRAQGGGASHLGYWMSVPALVQKTVWAEKNGYDAVIQSNNFEPGVEAARLAVRIPVIGLCRTTMHAAANLADRIGVTVPFDGYALLTRRMLQAYGLLDFVTDIRSLGLGGVPRGEEVDRARPKIQQRAVEVMRRLVDETKAECIVPLGGAVIPYIVSPTDLEREVGLPVLNPKAIGIRFAEMCVAFGMSHSERAYPRARLEDKDFSAFAYGEPVASAGR